MPRALSFLAAAAAFLACDPGPADVVCTSEARPGVLVQVLHGVTGEPAAEGAVLTLVDGDFVQVVAETTTGGLALWGATERPGTYDVRVEKEGFRAWERTDVEVPLTVDGCHVVTAQLRAELEPAG